MQSKAELQSELIKAEEEKLEVSKALVDLQIENTKLMEIVQNEKWELNNELVNAQGSLLEKNIKEQKTFETIAQLEDKMKELNEEKRDLEIEFIALKKNFIQGQSELEEEKKRNENIGLELINTVNENKALHEELNDIFKKTGSTNEENAKFLTR